MNRACRVCGRTPLVVMKRLDTERTFVECRGCRTGYWSTEIDDAFGSIDLPWERQPASHDEAKAGGWQPLAVRGQMPVTAESPTPRVLYAWFTLGRVPLDRVPWFAADWLVQGHDGEQLRTLAGEHGHDQFTVTELLPGALQEAGVPGPPSTTEAAAIAFDDLARHCLAGRISEREVARMIEEVVAAAEFEPPLYASTMGSLYGIDDEWEGGWGRGEQELVAAVRHACAVQLHLPVPPAGARKRRWRLWGRRT